MRLFTPICLVFGCVIAVVLLWSGNNILTLDYAVTRRLIPVSMSLVIIVFVPIYWKNRQHKAGEKRPTRKRARPPNLRAIVTTTLFITVSTEVLAFNSATTFFSQIPIRDIIYGLVLLIAMLALIKSQVRSLQADNNELSTSLQTFGRELTTLELSLEKYKKEASESFVAKDEWVRTVNKIDAKLDRLIERFNKYG